MTPVPFLRLGFIILAAGAALMIWPASPIAALATALLALAMGEWITRRAKTAQPPVAIESKSLESGAGQGR